MCAGGPGGATSATPTRGGDGGTSQVYQVGGAATGYLTATGGAGGAAASGGAASGTAAGGHGYVGPTALEGFGVSGGQPNSAMTFPSGVVATATGGASFGTPAQNSGQVAASALGQAGNWPGGGASGSANQAAGAGGADGYCILEY